MSTDVRVTYRVTRDPSKLLPGGVTAGQRVTVPVVGSISLADRIVSALTDHYLIDQDSITLQVKRGGRWRDTLPENLYRLERNRP